MSLFIKPLFNPLVKLFIEMCLVVCVHCTISGKSVPHQLSCVCKRLVVFLARCALCVPCYLVATSSEKTQHHKIQTAFYICFHATGRVFAPL
jgi:F0F1-type ATP synthase assembly protein I